MSSVSKRSRQRAVAFDAYIASVRTMLASMAVLPQQQQQLLSSSLLAVWWRL
jgi:hypothetical protein